jgi:hypothetical protein
MTLRYTLALVVLTYIHNSILYYLRTYSEAQRPIIKEAGTKEGNKYIHTYKENMKTK